MVSKPVVVGLVGGAAILAALGLNFWALPGDDGSEPARVSAPAVPTKPAVLTKPTVPAMTGATDQAASGTSTSGTSASSQSAETQPDPAKRPPSFDIVRVDPDGNTVIAGRGKPNTEITILSGDEELGRVTSDDRGEWVFLPDAPLGAGEFVLTLRQPGDAATAESDEAVVLVVPEVGKDIAGRDTDQPSQPLAMVLPRAEAEGRARAAAPGREKTRTARVLQAPSAGPATGPRETAGSAAAAADASKPRIQAFPQPATAPSATQQGTGGPGTEAASADVSVDVIEYDDKGEVVFGGRTEPDANVEVFIDNKPAGQATADADGRWQLRPADPVAPGNYTLRVDKVAPGGAVKARVAFPFVRAAPLTGLPSDRLVVIQPGNNLWVIATRVYGEGTRYLQIHDANRDQIQDPDLIYPGQVFDLPKVN